MIPIPLLAAALLVLVFCTHDVCGQVQTPGNAPVARLALAQPPNYCTWTITTEVFSASGNLRRKVSTITRTGESLSQIDEENGMRREFYRIGPIEYQTAAGPEEGMFTTSGSLPMEDGTFPEMAWLEPRYLLGTVFIQNQMCNVYADVNGKSIPASGSAVEKLAGLFPASGETKTGRKLLSGIIPPAVLAQGVRIACVNTQTNLPVLLQNAFEVRSYSFASFPAKDQPLPKVVQEAKERVEKTNRALYAPFARP